jgi:hypothetical protein
MAVYDADNYPAFNPTSAADTGTADPKLGQIDGSFGPIISGNTTSYIMRGYDGTLTQTVYWIAQTPDDDASEYVGPGPVTRIVLLRVE